MNETENVDDSGLRAAWLKLARGLARRVNLGWWGLYLVPSVAVGGMAFALMLLLIRNFAWLTLETCCVLLLALFVVAAVVAYWRSRRHFIAIPQALARLDAGCQLHNRLSAAYQGVGHWPATPAILPPKPTWNPLRTFVPLVASLSALLLAAFLPLNAADPASVVPPMRELSSWTAVDASIELMAEKEIVEKEALEQVRKQLDALRAQPRENWYRPGSMEASDHLREQVGQSARDLQQALEVASAALATAARNQLSDRARDALLDQLGQTLESMQQGMLPLDAETLAALEALASQEGLQGLSLDPEALKELLESLQAQGQALEACASRCRVEGLCQSSCTNGQCRAQGQICLIAGAKDGDDASGGISRSDQPGNTPLTFRPPQAPLQAGSPEALANRDLRQAALGDTVGLSTDEHAVDQTAWSDPRASGGAAAHLRQGGEAVWRQTVMPQEEAVLKAYFD